MRSSANNKDVIVAKEAYRLFVEATKEAEEQSPSSPAVALGGLVRDKLRLEKYVSLNRAILAAQLLIPLCPKKRTQLHQFVQTRII